MLKDLSVFEREWVVYGIAIQSLLTIFSIDGICLLSTQRVGREIIKQLKMLDSLVFSCYSTQIFYSLVYSRYGAVFLVGKYITVESVKFTSICNYCVKEIIKKRASIILKIVLFRMILSLFLLI